MQLVEELHDQPCDKTAVLLERWRGRPDVEHLEKLAMMELHIADEAGAAQELLGALERLLQEEESQRRYDELVSRHKQDGSAAGPEAEIDPPTARAGLRRHPAEPSVRRAIQVHCAVFLSPRTTSTGESEANSEGL